MEDDGGAVLGEHLAHPLLFLAVRQHRHGVERVPVFDELALDLEQVVLGVVEQDEPARAHARDLAAQLRSDRPAGAGDEDAAAGQVLADALDVHPHGVAAEDVLDLDLAHLAHQAAAGLEQLEDGRHRPHRHAAVAAGGDDLPAQGAGRRRDRDQDLLRLDVVEHPPELAGRAEHLEPAVDARALLARVVVDESDGPVAELRVAVDLAQQQPPAVARADDQDRAGALARPRAAPRPLVGGVHDEARAAEEDEHEQAVEDEDAGRDVHRHEAARRREQQLRLHDHDVGHEREHARQRRLRDPQVLALRRVAHPVPVDPEQREDRDAADDREPERADEQVVVEVGHAAGPVEAKAIGEEIGQRDQPGVQRDLRSGVAMDGKGRGAEPAAHLAHSIRGHGVRGLRHLGDLLRLSTGLIGMAMWVRASSSVTGSSRRAGA